MQRTSVFNKIRVILSHLKRRSFKDPYELSDHIAKAEDDAFEVPTAGRGRRYCEPATIRKSIRLAVRLKLVREAGECSLTADGQIAARDEESFRNILGAQIITYLKEKEFGVQRILETIDNMRPPDLPDADTIFSKGKTQNTDIEEEEFRKLLYLLSLCDKLERQPKYLYFRKTRATR